jgi:adenylate cyclase class 2
MSEEIEVKFLDINPKEIENKLKKIGAKKAFDKLYKVVIFDYPDLRLNAAKAWLRLRDEGDKITLSFKQRFGDVDKDDGQQNDEGMIEHEVTVNDFEQAKAIFLNIGMSAKFLEEKRRIRYLLDDIEFDIDYMPGLEPFLEIESNSWDNIDKGIKLLGLNPKDKKVFSAFQIYALKGINMLDYQEFKFDGLVRKLAK